jgi:hypothetical protein
MNKSRIALAVVVVSLACVACGDERDGASISAPVVLGTFEGTIDPELGLVDIRMVNADATASAQEQALTAVVEDKNGVRGTAAAIDRIEFAVECSGSGLATCGPPFAAPVSVVNGCATGVDSFELDVTVRSFFPGGLRAAYVEITSIRNLDVPTNNNTICNNDPVPRNLTVSGTALNSSLGLYRYGQLIPNATAPTGAPALAADYVHWKFRNPGGRFNFVGRVVAQPCSNDCTVATNINRFWEAEGGLNASVDAASEGNGVVYLGGSFNYVGPRTGAAAAIGGLGAAAPGRAAAVWPAVEGGQVTALIDDGAGGVYVGGAFTTVGGVTRNGIAHILANGSLDTAFTASVTGSVTALARVGSRLILGGTFTQVNATARTNLAAVDATTGALDASWIANANGAVSALIASGANVVVGGAFTTIDDGPGSVRATPRIARLAATSGDVDLAFSTRLRVNNGVVSAFVLGSDGNTLFFGGTFNGTNSVTGDAGNVTRTRLAAVALSTTTLSAFAASANGDVSGLARIGTSIYVVGNFGTFNGQTRARAAAVSESGVLLAWRPSVNSTLFAVAADTARNELYLGGTQTNRLTAVDGTVGTAITWAVAGSNNLAQQSSTATRAMIVVGGVVYVGGGFRSVGGVSRPGFAVLDLATGEATAASPYATQQAITALATLAGGDAIVGTAVSVDRVTPAGAIVWSRATNAPVLAAAVDGADNVYIGGTFTTVGGSARSQVAALDSNGTLLAWAPTATGGAVRAIGFYENETYLGGDFTAVNGDATAARLATLNLATGAAVVRRGWNANGTVFTVSPNRDFLFVGGAFTSIDGVARARIAGLDGAAVTTYAQAASSTVRSIAAVGNNLHIGGDLGTLGGGVCAKFCTQHIDGSTRGSFNGGLTASVKTLAVAGDVVLAGGSYFNSTVSGGAQRTGGAVLFAD